MDILAEAFKNPSEDTLEDLLSLEGVINKRSKWETYTFNDIPIPRVSNILSYTIGSEYLVNWALSLGKEKYEEEKYDTLTTGTLTHEMIEYYLIHHEEKEMIFKSERIKYKTLNAYHNFIQWYQDMINQGFTIDPIVIEQTVTTPWYGGTIDGILHITNPSIGIDENIIVDFKTSKQLTYQYYLQTYSYLWAVIWNQNHGLSQLPIIDGIGIIRVDKTSHSYQSGFLRYKYQSEKVILDDIANSFASMINWYYNQINMEYDMRKIRKMIK